MTWLVFSLIKILHANKSFYLLYPSFVQWNFHAFIIDFLITRNTNEYLFTCIVSHVFRRISAFRIHIIVSLYTLEVLGYWRIVWVRFWRKTKLLFYSICSCLAHEMWKFNWPFFIFPWFTTKTFIWMMSCLTNEFFDNLIVIHVIWFFKATTNFLDLVIILFTKKFLAFLIVLHIGRQLLAYSRIFHIESTFAYEIFRYLIKEWIFKWSKANISDSIETSLAQKPPQRWRPFFIFIGFSTHPRYLKVSR